MTRRRRFSLGDKVRHLGTLAEGRVTRIVPYNGYGNPVVHVLFGKHVSPFAENVLSRVQEAEWDEESI